VGPRTKKVLGFGAAALVALVATVMLVLSHDSPCGEARPVPGGTVVMKAVAYHCYGPPEVLELVDLPRPVPGDDELLVRVHAAAINPLESHYMRGKPYVMRLSSGMGRPGNPRLGVDFSGTVEAVGRNVTDFGPGDQVFGARNGALAEYVTVREDRFVALKPANVTFEEAAGVPVAGITALQALRDQGRIEPGQRVLVNGASGGVGTFAVQLGKSFGAHVTGVSSTRNLELVRSLGADHVIDYTQESFTESEERWDLIIDNVGNHPHRAYRRVLNPEGIVVMVGGPKDNRWFGPLLRSLRGAAYSPFVGQTFSFFISELRRDDLEFLGARLETGEVRTVIDGRFPLSGVPAAIEYLERGRTRGKNVILVVPEP
jgi:NADPH:quinone reductase-like Zn-dependent oxidoreductase